MRISGSLFLNNDQSYFDKNCRRNTIFCIFLCAWLLILGRHNRISLTGISYVSVIIIQIINVLNRTGTWSLVQCLAHNLMQRLLYPRIRITCSSKQMLGLGHYHFCPIICIPCKSLIFYNCRYRLWYRIWKSCVILHQGCIYGVNGSRTHHL
jgi:hypothetical protein